MLKTQVYYLTVLELRSPTWGSLGLNQGISRAVFLLEDQGEHLFPGLFQLLDTSCIPWLLDSFSTFRVGSILISLSSLPLPHPSVIVAPSLDLFRTLGITQIIQANLTISESLI